MSKKKISLIQSIIQLITLVSFFIPISSIMVYCKTSVSGKRSYSNVNMSLFETLDGTYNTFWMVLLIIFGIANLAYLILHFATKSLILKKRIFMAISCLSLPCLMFSAISIDNFKDGNAYNYTIYNIDWGFYLICAFCIAIIVLELYKHFSNLEEESSPRISQAVTIQQASSADELKKYRDLLDSGIITQEEFEDKKKQLLGH